MSKLKLVLIGIGVVLVAFGVISVVVSYVEWRREVALERQKFQTAVTEISQTTAQLLLYETAARSGSAGDVVERGGSELKKLDDTIRAVAASELPRKEKDALGGYLTDLQTLLRPEVTKYSKLAATASALDGAKAAANDLANPAYGNADAAKARFQQALTEAGASLEAMQAADGAFFQKVLAVQSHLAASRTTISDYSMIDDKLLPGIIAARKPAVQSQKK